MKLTEITEDPRLERAKVAYVKLQMQSSAGEIDDPWMWPTPLRLPHLYPLIRATIEKELRTLSKHPRSLVNAAPRFMSRFKRSYGTGKRIWDKKDKNLADMFAYRWLWHAFDSNL